MRILFFTDHFWPEPSAPAAHVFERCQLWARWGHQVTVVCAAPNFPEGKLFPGYRNRWRHVEAIKGVRVVRVKTFIHPNEGFLFRILDYLSYAVSAFSFAHLEPKPEVVISTSPHLFVPLGAAAYARLRRVPHVAEIRDLWPATIVATGAMKKGLSYRLLERIELGIYAASARIISLTHSFAEDMTARGVPRAKIDVVISGANLELFQPRPREEQLAAALGLTGRFVVGYLGTVGLAHGLENALAAAELLRGAPVTFLIVGTGAAKAGLEQLARANQLSNVVFVGAQAKEQMPCYWSVCDAALIHLKNSDTFKTVIPSKIFESMAMGVPILYVGPTGEGSRLVEAHEAGLAVPPADPPALAAAIRRFLDAPALRQRLAENSRRSAPKFSRVRQARDSLASLARALGKEVLEREGVVTLAS